MRNIIQGENGFYIFKVTGEIKSKFREKRFKKKRDELEQNLKAIKFDQLYKDLILKLRKRAEVKVYEQNL